MDALAWDWPTVASLELSENPIPPREGWVHTSRIASLGRSGRDGRALVMIKDFGRFEVDGRRLMMRVGEEEEERVITYAAWPKKAIRIAICGIAIRSVLVLGVSNGWF